MMKILRGKSLSYKIVAGFLISFCLPLVIFLGVWAYQISYMQENAVKNQVQSDINGIVKEIAFRVQEMEMTAKSIASNPEIIDYLQNYHRNPTRYMLEAIGDFGGFIGSISQINPRIQSMRIYSVDNQIPRYQNIIYSQEVMEGQPWLKRVKALSYGQSFLDRSAFLYGARNAENYQKLVYPMNSSNPRVFSLYRQIYAENSATPVGYLEICIRIEELLGVADTLTEGVDVLFGEEGTGILYSLGQNRKLESRLAEGGTEKISLDQEEYRIYEKKLNTPEVTLYYAYPMSLYYQTLHWGVWMVIAAILVSCGLMIIFLHRSFRLVPLRLKKLVKRMQQVRAGSMEVEFEDSYEDEISEVNQTLNQMLKHINSLINTVYRIELSEKEATLRFLRMQMDPHFLFNALEAIRMSVTLGYYDKVEEALVALSNILRVRLRSNAKSTVREELQMTQEYVKVENLRYNDHILLQIHSDEQLSGIELPSLMIQPLAANAIRHGYRQDRPYLMIRIEIRQEDGGMLIRVTDDGAGMTAEQLEKVRQCMREGRTMDEKTEHGTGLANLATRLRLNYQDGARIEIESLEGEGTQIEIRFREKYINKTNE